MPPADALTQDEVHRLPPMLFGRIRWAGGLGAPVGQPCSGFTIVVEEHTASQFRIGPGGVIEVIPGTGIWKTTTGSAPCRTLPDEGDKHVVGFDVPDVHLNAFPDGTYRVTPTVTGKWTTSSIQVKLGIEGMEPRAPVRVPHRGPAHPQPGPRGRARAVAAESVRVRSPSGAGMPVTLVPPATRAGAPRIVVQG